MSETLLITYMEFSNVGHVVEALRYALGYHAADRSRRIGLLLPDNSPRELAGLCPFVDSVYPVSPMVDVPASLAQVPREWDWIVDNPRRYDPVHAAAWDRLDHWFEGPNRCCRLAAAGPRSGSSRPATGRARTRALRSRRRTRGGPHAGERRQGADRRDADRQRPALPLPLDRLVGADPARTERAVQWRPLLLARESCASTSEHAAASTPMSSDGCSCRFRMRSTASIVRSWSNSRSSRPAICSSHRTPGSGWPRLPSPRRG